MAGWHYWYAENELGQTLGDGDGYGGFVSIRQWGCKESDMAGWLNNNNNSSKREIYMYHVIYSLGNVNILNRGAQVVYPILPLEAVV